MNKLVEWLGLKVEDKVTGFTGVVASISCDLYGCIQVLITPQVKKGENEYGDSRWFDTNRIKILSDKRVMELPDFEEEIEPLDYDKGPADKPIK